MDDETIKNSIEIARRVTIEGQTLEEAAEDVLGPQKDPCTTVDSLEEKTGLVWEERPGGDSRIKEFVSSRNNGKIQISYLEMPSGERKLAYGCNLLSTSVSVKGSIESGMIKLLTAVREDILSALNKQTEEVCRDLQSLQEEML